MTECTQTLFPSQQALRRGRGTNPGHISTASFVVDPPPTSCKGHLHHWTTVLNVFSGEQIVELGTPTNGSGGRFSVENVKKKILA